MLIPPASITTRAAAGALSFLPAGADALLVVPPFFAPFTPSFGVELLAACARRVGYRVATLYANLSLASTVGLDEYEDLCRADPEL
jgi:dihydrodipicolinate synthase/N-acetylneuraminate lyase